MFKWYIYFIAVLSIALVVSLVAHSIRSHQIKNLKQELELTQKENQRVSALLNQCQKDLDYYIQAYQGLYTQLKQRELDYAKKLKTYADEMRKLNIAQKYNIQVPYSNDTCSNLMHMLDRLTEVEKQ